MSSRSATIVLYRHDAKEIVSEASSALRAQDVEPCAGECSWSQLCSRQVYALARLRTLEGGADLDLP